MSCVVVQYAYLIWFIISHESLCPIPFLFEVFPTHSCTQFQDLLLRPNHICLCSMLLPYNSPGYLLSHGQNTPLIVNYSVQVYNRTTGELMNSFINVTSEMFSTTAPVTFIHNTPHGGVMRNCEELVFIVSAASTIGWGSPAIVTEGFPIGILCMFIL